MTFAADPPRVHGTLTKCFAIDEGFCYKIADTVSLAEEVVLMKPLAIAVHSIRLAELKPGRNVIVLGRGTVGLFCAAVAREFGAFVVLSIDEFARQFIGDAMGRTAILDSTISLEANARRFIKEC